MLLDESVPLELLLHLTGVDAVTVQALGWAGMKNGVWLRAARNAGYEILVTVDRRLEHQQNIPKSGHALVVLEARSTRVLDLPPLVPALLAALSNTRVGEVAHAAVLRALHQTGRCGSALRAFY